jgi:hypothetical protein
VPHQGQLTQASGKSNEKAKKAVKKSEKSLSSDFMSGGKVVVAYLFFLI